MKKHLLSTILLLAVCLQQINSQALRLPETANYVCTTGRTIGVTDISIHYNSPGVKGREGKIYGSNIVPFGYQVLGYGSNLPSPWRAGANECTTMEFSTDVTINGKILSAGKYAFFIAVAQDSSVLIFNKNYHAWGSYFYRKELDVLQVSTVQQKNLPNLQERLVYDFVNQTDSSVVINLAWEKWSFPIKVQVALKATILKSLQEQLSGTLSFEPASLEAAAQWCLQNNISLEEALNWINLAINPLIGGKNSFSALNIKANILKKLGNQEEASTTLNQASDLATVQELHNYGRQLLNEKMLTEAMVVFQKNYTKFKGAWPTNAGMMRMYAAMDNYKKALNFAKAALPQAPDEETKKMLEEAIKNLSEGKAL